MVKFSDFEQKFRETLDLDSQESVSETTALESLKRWDSLAVVSIIVMMDSDFGVWLSAADIRELKTVGDLFNKISKDKT